MFQRAIRHSDRIFDIEGLGQVLEGAVAIGWNGTIEIGMCRHDDHWQFGVLLLDRREQVQPADAGHADITDNRVG